MQQSEFEINWEMIESPSSFTRKNAFCQTERKYCVSWSNIYFSIGPTRYYEKHKNQSQVWIDSANWMAAKNN